MRCSLDTINEFERIAAMRGVPFAYIGMMVRVDGKPGVIVGANGSANFDIRFVSGKHAKTTINCHPNCNIEYLDRSGNVIKEFGL